MDVRDGGTGYPVLAPLPEAAPQDSRPQDTRPGLVPPGRDHLLSVTSAADARATLVAAKSLVAVDGRATAWTALSQLGHMVAFISLFVVVDRDSVPLGVAFLVFLGLMILSQLSQRASGVQPKRPSGRVVVACFLGGFAAVAVSIALDLSRSWFLGVLAACAVGAVATPIVRWVRSIRVGGHERWRPGAEAFAILSLLDAAAAVTPDYLGSRAELSPATRDAWIDRLRAEHAIMGGHERRRPLGRDWIRITETGRERLARMRLELEHQAAAKVSVG